MEIENIKDICIVDKKIKENLVIHPSDLRNIKKPINEMIIAKLNKFDKKQNGILISYQKAKRNSDSGEVIDEIPQIIIEVKYKAKIFYPQKGKLLVGKLSQIFSTHICCLVFGQFNALLWKYNIQNVLEINENENLIEKQTGKQLEIGDYIQFEVDDFEVESDDNYQIIGQIINKDIHGSTDSIKQKHSLLSQFQQFEEHIFESQEKLIEEFK